MRTDVAEIERRYGHPLVMLHRADLVGAFLDALPSECRRPGVTVTEADEQADLTVAADGIRSTLRARHWPDAPAPRYAGYTAWRMITDPLPGRCVDPRDWPATTRCGGPGRE